MILLALVLCLFSKKDLDFRMEAYGYGFQVFYLEFVEFFDYEFVKNINSK